MWIRHSLALAIGITVWLGLAAAVRAEVIDIATLDTSGGFMRVHGSAGDGDGSFGVPVAGGADCDDDGARDIAFAAMRANPFGRDNAGEVYLVFGDATISGTLDTADMQPRILVVTGAHISENAGSEIWMDDVTGDGVGDLLVARQNHDADAARLGAGALSIVVGGPELAAQALTGLPLDLAAPPQSITVTTPVGAAAGDRLGIWMRTGDVDGDAIADIVVGADQQGPDHRGGAWVVRGGSHLAAGGTIDLASFGSTAIVGHLARLTPSLTAPVHSHLGATVQIGDLDGNGRAEVLIAATLNRAGGGLQSNLGGSHGSGGEVDGTLYIAWDDNFSADPWTAGYTFAVDATPGTGTAINGSIPSRNFGEEIIAGFDFDDDDNPDLFVGDIVGDASPLGNRPGSGHGYVFYHAAGLAGLSFDLGSPPPGLVTTLILGAATSDLAADTAIGGDFDADGIDDLSIASPHHDSLGRDSAGAHHVLFGNSVRWPAVIDLASLPDPSVVRITELFGAEGTAGSSTGDTLGYSAAAGFIDADARLDLITNEMVGDGLGGTPEDVGNLVVVSGALLAPEPPAALLAAVALLAVAGLKQSQWLKQLKQSKSRMRR